MSYLDDFNTSTVFDTEGGSNAATEKMLLKVELYQAQEGKDKEGKDIEFIQIQLKNKAKELISVRQYLNKKEDGTYKKHIYPGFNDILPSISYEILQRAKEYMGEEKYEAAKTKFGGVTRKLFESLYFEIDVKRINDGEYLIPMFAYQVKKDADYKANRGGSETPAQSTPQVDPNDLPF